MILKLFGDEVGVNDDEMGIQKLH